MWHTQSKVTVGTSEGQYSPRRRRELCKEIICTRAVGKVTEEKQIRLWRRKHLSEEMARCRVRDMSRCHCCVRSDVMLPRDANLNRGVCEKEYLVLCIQYPVSMVGTEFNWSFQVQLSNSFKRTGC